MMASLVDSKATRRLHTITSELDLDQEKFVLGPFYRQLTDQQFLTNIAEPVATFDAN